MCIIITKAKSEHWPKISELEIAMSNNPDGYGIAYIDRGLNVFKTTDRELFIDTYKRLAEKLKSPCVIHFRIMTHGEICDENSHPFIDKDRKIAFAHNGVLSIRADKGRTDSETFFANLFLPIYYSQKYKFSDSVQNAIQCIIGSSKFAFLDKNGNLFHFGQFIKFGKLLASNSTFNAPKVPKYNEIDWQELWRDYESNKNMPYRRTWQL
jgi:predicted glutamine amidotransferase